METENNMCSICLHEFTQPKLLTCLHSYCYRCLLDYVNRSKQDGDQFPCPLCRHQIRLPSGGVQDFPDSPHGQVNEVGDVKDCRIEVEKAGDSRHVRGVELLLCTAHPHELINFHCTQCTMSVCLLCFAEHHNGHKMLYLKNEATQTKLRQDLQKLNDDLQLQIDRLETFSQQLASESSKLQNSTEQECNAVDDQVQLICKMVKTRGDEIKTMLRYINDVERKKLEILMTEMESSMVRLKSDVNKASDSLEGKSIIKILKIIQINQKVETEYKLKDLALPDLENPSFNVGKIIEDELFQQLGSYENSEEQILNYNINTILKDENLIQGEKFTFSGLKWRVGAQRDTNDYVGVSLSLCKSDSNSRGKGVEYSFTLINKTPSKSITMGPTTVRFTPGGLGCGYLVTPWSTLIDPSNGFTDKDGHFSVRIGIKTLIPKPV